MAFDLKELGWDDQWAKVFAPFAADGLVPARVAIEFNYIYRLYAEAGELQAQHAGRLRHEAESKEQLSAVGDWVAARPSAGEATATIEAVLPRRSRFSRKVAGELTEEQIVAANIDTVFIVMGLDGDYNPRRLERYLLLAYESGASPVVILNKSDVADHLSEDLDEIRGLAVGIPVHAISAKSRSGIEVVEGYLGPGRTGGAAWLVGSGQVDAGQRADRRGAAQDPRRARQRLARPSHHASSPADRAARAAAACWSIPRACASCSCGRRTKARAKPSTTSSSWRRAAISPIAGIAMSRAARSSRRSTSGTLAADRLEGFFKLQEEMHSLETRKNVRAQIDEKRKIKTVSQSLKKLYKSRDR